MIHLMKKLSVFVTLFVLMMSSVFAAQITLTSPLGGEFLADDDIVISWSFDSGAATDSVEVQFSADSGAAGTWTSLTTTANADDESFTWDTSALTDSANYRVRLVSTGNEPDEISGDFALDKTAPIPVLENETIDEGDDVTFDASASYDDTSSVVLYEFDIDNDSTYDYNGTDSELDLTWADLVSFGIDNDGTYTIGLQITDSAGNVADTTAELTVENVEPVVEFTFPLGGEELTGDVAAEFEITDPVDTTFDCDLYYEDLFAASGLVLIDSFTCDVGANTAADWDTSSLDSDDIVLYIEVDDGVDTADDTTGSFLVDNTAPVVEAGANFTVAEGDLASFNFSAEDGTLPDGSWFDDDTQNFGVTFGDSASGLYDDLSDIATITHTYTDNGVYDVEFGARDDVGFNSIDALVVTVTNVDPEVTAGDNETINEGDILTLNSLFSDAGSSDTHSAEIDWGDGSPVEAVSVAVSPLTNSHQYVEDGVYTVTVTVTDDDGGFDSDTFEVTVENVNPSVEITSPVDGEYLAGDVSIWFDAFDPGFDDVFFEVFYKLDGGSWVSFDSFTELAYVNDSFEFVLDTTALDDGTYSLKVEATDDDAGFNESIVSSLIIDNTMPETVGPEISLDVFRPGSYVWFSASTIDANILASARVHVFDEGVEIPSSPWNISSPDDGTFDETVEDLGLFALVDLADGTYTYSIVGQDSSGNWEEPTTDNTDSFIVDSDAVEPGYTNDEIDAFIDALETSIDGNSDAIADLEADLLDLASDVANNTALIADLQSQIDDLSSDVATNAAEIASLISQVSDLEDDVDALELAIADIESDISDLQDQVTLNVDDIADLQTLVSTLEGNVTDLDSRLTTLEDEVSDLADTVSTLETSVSDLESSLSGLGTDLADLESSVADLEDEMDAYFAFSLADATTNTQTTTSFDVSLTTSRDAVCTITDAFDASVTTTTSAGTAHTLSETSASLGLNIYQATCVDSEFGFSKELLIPVNVVGIYTINIPGQDEGFTSLRPNFFLSSNQLEATSLSDYAVGTVLSATAGPESQRLNSSDVEMVWSYDGSLWTSFNVSSSTGDFQNFTANGPSYYELVLKTSAAGKAIRHD